MHIADMTMFCVPVSRGVYTYPEAKYCHLWYYPGIHHSMLVPGVDYHQVNDAREVPAPPLSFGNGYRSPPRHGPWYKVLHNLQLDPIEVGDPYLTAWAAPGARHRLDVPVIGFYHSDLPLLVSNCMGAWLGTNTGNYVSKLYGHFDRTLAPGQVMAEKLMHLGVANIHVQPPGVDLITSHPSNQNPGLRQKLDLDKETRLLVFTGRGSQGKNLSVLFDAIQRPGDGYHLLLISLNMPTRVPCSTSAVDYFYDSREVARLLASSDALLHVGGRETFDLVALEAMANGIPVVTVHAETLAEVVPERYGVLHAPNNGDVMAYTVRELFNHDVELRNQHTRRRVEHQHAQDAMVTSLLLHYHTVLGNNETRLPRYD